jgi:hypothetical protein
LNNFDFLLQTVQTVLITCQQTAAGIAPYSATDFCPQCSPTLVKVSAAPNRK